MYYTKCRCIYMYVGVVLLCFVVCMTLIDSFILASAFLINMSICTQSMSLQMHSQAALPPSSVMAMAIVVLPVISLS